MTPQQARRQLHKGPAGAQEEKLAAGTESQVKMPGSDYLRNRDWGKALREGRGTAGDATGNYTGWFWGTELGG